MAQLIASRRESPAPCCLSFPSPLLTQPDRDQDTLPSRCIPRFGCPELFFLFQSESCSLTFSTLIIRIFLAFISLSRWPSPSWLLCLLLEIQTRTPPLGIPPRGHLIESIAPLDRVPAILPLLLPPPSSLSSPPSPLPHWSHTLIPSSLPKLPSLSSIPPPSDSPPRPFRSVPPLLPRRIPFRVPRRPHRRLRRGAQRMVQICLTSTLWRTMASGIRPFGHFTAPHIVL